MTIDESVSKLKPILTNEEKIKRLRLSILYMLREYEIVDLDIIKEYNLRIEYLRDNPWSDVSALKEAWG